MPKIMSVLTHASLLRIGRFRLGLLGSVALAAPTHAQLAPPPVRPAVDENGVDVIQKTFNFSKTDVSIGPAYPHGLSFTRSAGNGLWNSAVATIVSTGSQYIVTHDNISDSFSSSTLASLTGDGATLSMSGTNFTYTGRNGTVIQFAGPSGRTNGYVDSLARANSIKYPDGTILTFTYSAVYVCPGWDGSTCMGTRYNNYRLQSVTNNFGYQLWFQYQINGIPVAPDTSDYVWQYNNLISVTAMNNAVQNCIYATCTPSSSWPQATYSQAESGPTLTVTDPLNRTTTYTRSANGFSIRRPASSSDDITVASSSGSVSSVNRDGINYNYTYADSGSIRTTTVTDPSGHQRIYTSDTTLGVIKSYTDENGHTTTYTPDTYGRITQVTLPEGNTVQYSYDARGNITQSIMTSKTLGTPANIMTTANFDASCANAVKCNQPNWVKDANGNESDYGYDPTTGLLTTMTQPAPTSGGVRPQSRTTYAALQAYYLNTSGSIAASGAPVYLPTGISVCHTTASCTGTADESKVSISYGPQATGTPNNLLPISQSNGSGNGALAATNSVTYDTFGNISTSTDPLGRVATYYSDLDREVYGVVGPDPDGSGPLQNRAVRYTYNADGLITLIEQGTTPGVPASAPWSNFSALQQIATSYDNADRKAQVSAQAGGTTYAVAQYSYDSLGRSDCTAQRMNPATFGALPASACTLGTAGSFGPDRISRNSYDNAGQLLKVTSGYGVSGLQRDETTYTYSKNGKVQTLADAKNNLTTYVYDGFDRLSQTQYPSPTTAGSSNAADYEQLGYDANGNVTSRRLRDGNSIGYTYDALNRRTFMDLPATGYATDTDVTYSYDLLGELLSANDTVNHRADYTYDALGRQLTETSAWGTKTSQYDLAGRRTRLTWPDGFYVTYDYDNVGEMTAIHENGGFVLASFGYDDLGRRVSRSLGNGTSTSFGYDAVSRLTSLSLNGGTNPTSTTFGNYNPAGEIGVRTNSNDAYAWTQGVNVNRSYVPNGLNQYATIAGSTQRYDARGNLITSNGTSYTYNSKNQLFHSGSASYNYDAIGRLDRLDPAGTRLDSDGDHLITESNSSNTVLSRYVFGPGADEPIVWYNGADTSDRRYLDQDERGSITRITKQDGSTLAINSYDEFGIPGSANQGRFQYTGQAWMPEIGMYYYKARMYSPTFGRFMQTDPIGYGDGPNWYNYTHGNPVSGTDPSGQCETCTPIDPDYANAEARGYDNRWIAGTGTNIAGHNCESCDISSYEVNGSAGGSSGNGDGRGGSVLIKTTYQLTLNGVNLGYPWYSYSSVGSSGFSFSNGGAGSSGDPRRQTTHEFVPPDDGSGDIIVTAHNQISDYSKWILAGNQYYLNPYYRKPWFDIGLDGYLEGTIAAFAVASTPAAPLLTARGTGLLNSNNIIRWGFNWKGSAQDGSSVFRLAIGKWHIWDM